MAPRRQADRVEVGCTDAKFALRPSAGVARQYLASRRNHPGHINVERDLHDTASITVMETVDSGTLNVSSPPVPYTDRQGQCPAFIHACTMVNERPVTTIDMRCFFGLAGPSVTRYCSASGAAGSFGAHQDGPALSKCSSPEGPSHPAMNAQIQPIITSVQRH